MTEKDAAGRGRKLKGDLRMLERETERMDHYCTGCRRGIKKNNALGESGGIKDAGP